nr:hypothetical protein [Acidimicrobiia bacterium]
MAADRCPDCGKPLTTRPRFATKPTPRARGWWRQIHDAAEQLGTPLMPWQAGAARLIGELRPDGLPRYKRVIISVPRQQGKTTISKAAIKAVAEARGDQEIYGTAQTRQYAAKHVVNLGRQLKRLSSDVKVLAGVGAESVTWPNGTIYRPLSPTEGGGHGDSIDWLLVDEAWTITPELLGGVVPAMIARPLSQLVAISTMGTVDSTSWNGWVAEGREAVDDPNALIAYVEYSAEEDEHVFDEKRWHEWMPALGRTISHEAIREAMRALEAAEGTAEVVRAFGNRTTRGLVTLFPTDRVEKAWRIIDPPQRMVLAVDVNDEPVGASVASGHVTDEHTATRLIRWQYGSPRWVPDLVKQVIAHRKVEAVVYDPGSPTKQIEADLQAICEAAFVPLVKRSPRDFGGDCARFYDALAEGRAAIEKAEPLAEAIVAAQRKDISGGELWVVSRSRTPVDASPLIAVIMAHGLAEELAVSPKVTEVAFAW